MKINRNNIYNLAFLENINDRIFLLIFEQIKKYSKYQNNHYVFTKKSEIEFWKALYNLEDQNTVNMTKSKNKIADFWKQDRPIQKIKKIFFEKKYQNKVCQKSTLKLSKKLGINEILLSDSIYPKNLLRIFDPPKIIYAKGNLKLLNFKLISIVGTRKNTKFGKEEVQRITSMSKYYGLTTVSGLARGIDRLVHEYSIEKNLHTIAVLPIGVDQILPKEHNYLAQSILDNDGLLISEIPPQSEYSKWSFPRRNRIIAGLGDVVIVVEAPLKSGALITAKYAWQADIPLYVSIPGIKSKNMRGNFNLLDRDRAHVITPSMQNLLIDLNLPLKFSKAKRAELFSKNKFKDKILSDKEKEVYIIIQNGYNTVTKIYEQIIKRNIKINLTELNSIVARMQLNKVIDKDEYGNLF